MNRTKLFIRFLKENNCYREFIKNINNYNSSFILKRNEDIKEFLLNTDSSNLMTFSFDWRPKYSIQPKKNDWLKIAKLWNDFIVFNDIK